MVEGHFKEFFMFQVDFVFFSVRFLIFFLKTAGLAVGNLKKMWFTKICSYIKLHLNILQRIFKQKQAQVWNRSQEASAINCKFSKILEPTLNTKSKWYIYWPPKILKNYLIRSWDRINKVSYQAKTSVGWIFNWIPNYETTKKNSLPKPNRKFTQF